MADLWSGLFALGGAGLGFLGANITTTKQLAHAGRMEDLRLKRETFQAFTRAGADWSDAAMLYGLARVSPSQHAEEEWKVQLSTWRELNDAYSLLLLVGSEKAVLSVENVFVPARDTLIDSVSSSQLDAAAVRAASRDVKEALNELVNVFREELGESRVAVEPPA